jgi:hypothetical protein
MRTAPRRRHAIDAAHAVRRACLALVIVEVALLAGLVGRWKSKPVV